MKRTKKDPRDRLIEQTWYKLAEGVEVSILDIPLIFDNAKKEMGKGSTVEEAVKRMIACYRKN